jgi:Holliday junction resolvase RusA-like endonuclease
VRLVICVFGRPAPQGSKQIGGAGQLLEQSAYLPAWRVAVKVAAYKAYQAADIRHTSLPVFAAGTPVVVEQCTFYVGDEQCRAEGTDQPLGTPDIDKLLRATLDALGGQQNGSARLFADDAQVVRIRDLAKERSAPGRPTGALIIVSDGRE